MPWLVVPTDNEFCVHKKNADGSAGEKVACHPTRDAANKQLAALNARESGAFSLIDKYVTTEIGDWFRWMPFGRIMRTGEEITRELAEQFRLPHYKPPIKLGSHDDSAPAAGHIVGVEVREDGIWVQPEWNARGLAAQANGDFRYHSPEPIGQDGFLESPDTGKMESGPFVMGTALLHDPYFGEQAAFYQVDVIETEQDQRSRNMSTTEVPTSVWDKVWAKFSQEPKGGHVEPSPAVPATPASVQPQPDPELTAATEQFNAEKAKADAYAAEIKKLKDAAVARDEADKTKKAQVAMVAVLQDKERFGVVFAENEYAGESADLIASLPEEVQKWILKLASGLAAQVDESALTGERGTDADTSGADGGNVGPVATYEAAIVRKSTENKISWPAAKQLVDSENPELMQAYQTATRGK